LLKKVKLRAKVLHRSFNQEIIYLLRKALDDAEHYDEEALRILRTHMSQMPSGPSGPREA
jgi:hypothetical protein